MFLPQFFWYTHPLDSFDFFTLSKVMSKDILDGLFPKRNVPLLRISIFIFEVHPPPPGFPVDFTMISLIFQLYIIWPPGNRNVFFSNFRILLLLLPLIFHWYRQQEGYGFFLEKSNQGDCVSFLENPIRH